MWSVSDPLADLDGPSLEDLHAIDREQPVRDAEMRLVDAEAAVLARPSRRAWRKLRRAVRRVVELTGRPPTCLLLPGVA